MAQIRQILVILYIIVVILTNDLTKLELSIVLTVCIVYDPRMKYKTSPLTHPPVEGKQTD